jgi:RNA polymerase sigma factor (sigma-70 family)
MTGQLVMCRMTETRSSAETESARDAALMVRVACGEHAALDALHDRFVHRVHSLARRICGHHTATQDVVQEVFLEVWLRSRRFDPTRGSVTTWLLTLTHHKAVDAVRREATLRRHHCPAGPADAADIHWERLSGPGADHAAIDSVVAGYLRGALAQLPPPLREALALAYYGGYTQSEVAAILGIPLGTVKSRTFTAMARLREELQQLQDAI